jgi:hypothetical protein
MFPDIFGWMRIAGIAALVAGVVGVIAYAKGNMDGRAYERAKQVREAMEAIEERGRINEEVRELDDGSLVCDILGGLPDGCH